LNQENTLPCIGVLAIQGDYAAHAEALSESGAEPVEVRKPDQLAGLDGLILPGGESTTVLRFLEKLNFFEVLQEFCGRKPVFGTCAGAILLAREVVNPPQRSLGVLDAVVERNAYGRQIDSTILTAQTELPGGRSARFSGCFPYPGQAAPDNGGDLSPRALLRPARASVICEDRCRRTRTIDSSA
jgi:5'-phosphate synthase pdxT subunit